MHTNSRHVAIIQSVGFGVTALLGTLLHFLYGWLKESPWIAPLSAVNESTWEHMKILFWPMLIYAAVESRILKERADFWQVKLRGITVGLLLVPILYYTYNGAIAPSPNWLNVAIFYISALTVYLYETCLFRKESPYRMPKAVSLLILIAIGILFVTFSYFTPRINIFLDPVSGSYGR